MEVGLQGQTDLVIGAAISLLSALLTFLLTSSYQWMVANREREWQLEDRKKQREQEIEERKYFRRQQVLIRRLEEAEKSLNKLLDICEIVTDYEYSLLKGYEAKIPSRSALSKVIDDQRLEIFRRVNPMLSDVARSRSSIYNLGDDELTKLSIDLQEKIFSEFEVTEKLEESIKNKKTIDSKREHERIYKFYKEIMDIRILAIKRIDHLLGFQSSN